MASEKPAQLWLFIDLTRESEQYGCLDPSDRKCTHSSGKFWRFDRLPDSQRKHYLDWVLVNRTSRLFRQCGRPAFFREKDFSVSRRFFGVLQDLEGAGATNENLALAKACVRHLVTPIEMTYSTELWKLQNLRQFRQIRSLRICIPIFYRMGRIFVAILEESAVEKQGFPVTTFEKHSKELGGLLDVWGVNVDKLTISWSLMDRRGISRPFKISEQRKISEWLSQLARDFTRD
ncbi:MAG: hypothetical protein Q9182_001063 [Xanthomendoza sp. 2 TL-2023]